MFMKPYPEIAAINAHLIYPKPGRCDRRVIHLAAKGAREGNTAACTCEPICFEVCPGVARALVGRYLQIANVAAGPVDRQVVGEAAAGVHAVFLNGGTGNVVHPDPVAAGIEDLKCFSAIMISPRQAAERRRIIAAV